jgi:hypothetical protein
MKGICFSPTALRFSRSAYRRLPTGFRIQESGVRMKGICFWPAALRFCLPLTADCLPDSGFGIQEVRDQIPGDRR